MRYYQIIQKLRCLFLYFKNKVDIIFIPLYWPLKLLLLMTEMNVYSYFYDWWINISDRRESDRPSHKGSFTVLCILYYSPHSLAVPCRREWKSWNGSYLWDGGWVWCFRHRGRDADWRLLSGHMNFGCAGISIQAKRCCPTVVFYTAYM